MKAWKLRSYTLFVCLGLLVALVAGIMPFLAFQNLYGQYNDLVVESYGEYIDHLNKNTLASMAAYVEKELPVLHDTARLKREAGTSWFWNESRKLTEIRDIFHLAYIYYIEKSEDGYIFLMSAGVRPDRHPEWLGGPVWQGESPPFIDEAWETGRPTFSPAPTVNEWGTLISAELPIITDGAVVGILGVDYDVSFLEPLFRRENYLEEREAVLRRRMLGLLGAYCVFAMTVIFFQMRLGYRYIIVPIRKMEADERAHLILDATPLACAIFDNDRNMIDCNTTTVQLYGFRDKQECLDTFFDNMPKYQQNGLHSLKVIKDAISDAREKGSASFDLEYRHRDGRLLPLEVTLVQLPWVDGYRIATFGRDLREFRAKERALNEALLKAEEGARAKTSFLARMSHEIRTPLNSILGISELILRKDYPAEMLEYVSFIYQSGQNLLAIINDILDYTKIESGKTDVITKKYSVASLLYEVTGVIRARLIGRHVAFIVRADPNIPAYLTGDLPHIRQIILNLLGNAVNYTQTGYIALDMRSEDMGENQIRMIFRVEDTGVGIKKENMDKLFRDFSRLENPGAKTEGSGLGLVISESLCHAMGGTIDVESEYGKGSVFTLTIPQSCDEYQKLAEVLDPRKKRVLFMEENAVKASSLRYAFTGLGISPFHAENFDIFREELKRGVHDYAFTASKYAVESVRCISDMKRGKPQIVAMVDMGDTAIYGYGIKNILRPIYCVDVANILNGVVDERNVVTDKKQGLFSASSAVALVADDVSTNLRVSKELLQLYGMEVHTCMSGAEAIELVAAKRYDIVFMDHMMPGMDGTEATKIIRALGENDPYFTALPIIALTANAVSGAREIFLENGMNDFLSKPIEIQRLTEILKKWLPGEKQAEAGDSPQEQGTFTIPGVSVDIGLRHIEWNMRMYKEILRDFCADASECADRIRENLRAGNIQEYRVSVHGIKGAARSIGAVEFARFAQELEDAAKAGERAALDEKTEEFLLTLQTLTANIKGALLSGDAAETPCVEPDTAHLHLDSLKEALIDMDAGTINDMLLKYMELSDGTKIRESIREIEQHILSFEYDKAIEKIDGILRQSEPG